MTAGYLASYIFLWVLVVILALLVLLLYRQYGLTYLGSHAYADMLGLDLGAHAGDFAVVGLDGVSRHYSFTGGSTRSLRAVVFASSSCTVCGRLAESAVLTPLEWPDAEFYWIEEARVGRPRRAIDDCEGWVVGVTDGGAESPHRKWRVANTPFMFVLDGEGVVRAKGIVNSGDDISRLVANVGGSRAPTAARRSDHDS